MTDELDEGPSLLELRLHYIRCMALAIKMGDPLDEEDRDWLSDAVKRIGEGENPVEVLQIRGQRGQRRTKASAGKANNTAYAVSMVYMLMQPPDAADVHDRGAGKSFDDALDLAAKTTGLDRDTIRDYRTKNPDLRRRGFNPPLAARPLWPEGE